MENNSQSNSRSLLKKISGSIISILFFIVTFLSFIIYVLAEDKSEKYTSLTVCLVALVITGIGVFLFSNKLTIRRTLAWTALIGGMIMFGMSFYNYASYGHSIKHLWMYILPYPAFTLIIWGSYYLVGSVNNIKKLKTNSIVVWGYTGLIGGTITLFLFDPFSQVTAFRIYSYYRILLYAGTFIAFVVLPVVWFVSFNRRTRNKI